MKKTHAQLEEGWIKATRKEGLRAAAPLPVPKTNRLEAFGAGIRWRRVSDK